MLPHFILFSPHIFYHSFPSLVQFLCQPTDCHVQPCPFYYSDQIVMVVFKFEQLYFPSLRSLLRNLLPISFGNVVFKRLVCILWIHSRFLGGYLFVLHFLWCCADFWSFVFSPLKLILTINTFCHCYLWDPFHRWHRNLHSVVFSEAVRDGQDIFQSEALGIAFSLSPSISLPKTETKILLPIKANNLKECGWGVGMCSYPIR